MINIKDIVRPCYAKRFHCHVSVKYICQALVFGKEVLVVFCDISNSFVRV